MKTYSLDAEEVRAAVHGGLSSPVSTFLLFAITYGLVKFTLHSHWSKPRHFDFVGALIEGVIWGAGMTFFFSKRKPYPDGYEITLRNDELQATNRKPIQCREIKTILEKKNGLIVSDRNRFGTFMWGGIWIPRVLPEFQELSVFINMCREAHQSL